MPGPYGHAVVRTYDPASRQFLDIKFCPGKYFQGHNAFASGNLKGLVVAGVLDVLKRLGITLPEEEKARLPAGDVDLHEVHCTAMVDLGSDAAVNNAIAHIYRGRHQRLAGPGKHPGTPTFGKGGSYQVKFYNKHLEMGTNSGWGETYDRESREAVFDGTVGKLRVEVCLKRRKLKRLGLEKASAWSLDMPGRIVREQLGLMRVNEAAGLSPEVENTLKTGEQKAYNTWKCGGDWKRAYKSSSCRKKYRKRFLELGIDISVPYQIDLPPEEDQPDVIPFSQIQKLPFAAMPKIETITEVLYEPENNIDWITTIQNHLLTEYICIQYTKNAPRTHVLRNEPTIRS